MMRNVLKNFNFSEFVAMFFQNEYERLSRMVSLNRVKNNQYIISEMTFLKQNHR